MCRSIKTLREPFTEDVTDADVQAAALQYVRKISGFRTPAPRNAAAFDAAVRAVTEATATMLATLEVRASPSALTPDERAARAREERRSRELRLSGQSS
jgi:hypothetical protein